VVVDESTEAQVDAKLPEPLCTAAGRLNKLDPECAATLFEIVASVNGITATGHVLSGCSRCTYAPQSPRISPSCGDVEAAGRVMKSSESSFCRRKGKTFERSRWAMPARNLGKS
jgi:hypothetical protein